MKLCMFCIALRCAVVVCFLASGLVTGHALIMFMSEEMELLVLTCTGQNLAGNGSVFGIVAQSGIPSVA